MKIIDFEEKKACFGDLSIFGKIAASGPYRRGDFLVDFEYFLKSRKYPSNSSETFKILFFHENNLFEEKKACFGDTLNFRTKIAVSGPYRCAIFWLILSIFWNVENTLPILLKHSKFHSFMKIITLKKKSMFWGLLNFRQNRCIRTLPAWPFFGWFWVFFEILKIPFKFFRNIQNFVLSWKQSVWRKKSMFWGLLNFRQNRCIRTLPACHFFVDF